MLLVSSIDERVRLAWYAKPFTSCFTGKVPIVNPQHAHTCERVIVVTCSMNYLVANL